MQMPSSLIDSQTSAPQNMTLHSNEVLTPAALRALVVEDDPDIANLLCFHLQKENKFQVETLASGALVLQKLEKFRPHILVLDIMLPEQMGTDVLKQIRQHKSFSQLPVILLTAKSHESDKIEGLQLGADDYITKPFSPKELMLRIDAILRRQSLSTAISQSPSSIGPITVDRSEHKVTVNGQEIALTVIELQLLEYLMERAGRLCSRESLLRDVWKYGTSVNTRTVDTHIKRLRQKLGSAGMLIETQHGFGYKLKVPS